MSIGAPSSAGADGGARMSGDAGRAAAAFNGGAGFDFSKFEP